MQSLLMPPPTPIRLRREAWGFALGSFFFLVGAIPFYAVAVGPAITNLTFFIGALCFTAAAFIQLSLSGRRPPHRSMNRPDAFDWWGSAIQFLGTLFFNLSTTEALITALNSDTRVNSGWAPDAVGSVCFLVASAFAVVATTERDKLGSERAHLAVHLAEHARVGLLRPVSDRRIRASGDRRPGQSVLGESRHVPRCRVLPDRGVVQSPRYRAGEPASSSTELIPEASLITTRRRHDS